ncbi:MAG TPA: metal ABC transporter ATP-binding protein [Tissierellia bacterium]|jgi:zinc transport system ATP-binding protein|nr:metal ABC transporter ATP-binding protein [Tissierellia bacterium]
MTLIEAKNISLSYGSVEALHNVSFAIEEGEHIGIVGPNGSGKTSLVRSILGLEFPQKGELHVRTESIGYLPQQLKGKDPLFPATVSEIVEMGVKRKERFRSREAVAEVLADLAISDLADRRIGSLSGGQLQRVHLARALVSDPKLLILDEPTSALDPKTRSGFYSLMDHLKEDGVTILLVTHDVATVGTYTDKILYLDQQLIFFGEYDEFCESGGMGKYFGQATQHQHCWRHE